MTISGAAKVANTKKDFMELKAAQAKSDIRNKFAGGMGEVDPEVYSEQSNFQILSRSCLSLAQTTLAP